MNTCEVCGQHVVAHQRKNAASVCHGCYLSERRQIARTKRHALAVSRAKIVKRSNE